MIVHTGRPEHRRKWLLVVLRTHKQEVSVVGAVATASLSRHYFIVRNDLAVTSRLVALTNRQKHVPEPCMSDRAVHV